MEGKRHSWHGILPTAFLAFGVLSALIRMLLITNFKILPNELDQSYYYLKFGGANALFVALVAILCIAALLAAANVKKRCKVQTAYLTRIAKISSLACGIAILPCTALYLINLTEPGALFVVFAILFALLSAARMILPAIGKIKMRTEICAYLGMSVTAFYAVRILCDFVTQTASPLDMSGAYHFLMLIVMMFFWLQETRASLGKPQKQMYLTFGFLSLTLAPIYALPTLVLRLTSGLGTVSQACISVLEIIMCVYIHARLSRAIGDEYEA